MECYIKYLDSKNRFQETKKEFKDTKSAEDWMRKNLEKFDLDYIHYY